MKPTAKVTAQALGGALAAVGMGVFAIVSPENYQAVPPGFEAGIAVIFGAMAGYFKAETV